MFMITKTVNSFLPNYLRTQRQAHGFYVSINTCDIFYRILILYVRDKMHVFNTPNS